MALITELIATPNFDNIQNLTEVIKMNSVEKANEIGNKSLEYGYSYSQACLKQYASIYEKLNSDIFYCQYASEILKTSNPKLILDDLIINLTEIASYLFTEENIEISVTGDQSQFNLMEA